MRWMTAAGLLACALGLPRAASAADASLTMQTVRRVPFRAGNASALDVVAPVLHGIPVRRASRTVPVDGAGTWLRAPSAPTLAAPQVEPDEAAVAAEALPELVAEALGADAPTAFESAPTLVYVAVLGRPVLAWEVQLPLTLRPTPSRRTLWMSAMTGRLLDEVEQVRSAQARVFLENPSTTPEPTEVTLPRIESVPPGGVLESETIAAFNCVAEPPKTVPDWVDEGDCYPVHSAMADADGNFFPRVPDVIIEGDNVQADDAYAELSMFFHGARFLDVLADKGVPQFQCEQATMLANVRALTPTDDLDFEPVNNAFYTNQCDPERGVAMLFGQGSDVDFAYDGDVVYHELGHGVVAMLTPEGLNGRKLREDGSLVDAGGMNEAIADYMAYMMTDDPRVGEYVGRFWTATSRTEIRTGENTKTCPDDTIGQVHNDGEPFAAALWSVRARVGPSVDTLVLRALPRMPSDASLEEGAAALLVTAAELVDEGTWDDDDVTLLERALSTRGLLDCPRVITDQDEVEDGRTMHLRRRNATLQPFLPGPMQLRYVVPPGTERLEVQFGLRGVDDEGNTAAVLVKRADAMIRFSYDLIALDDPGDATGETGRIREVTLVEGDWDLELEPVEQPGGGYVAVVPNMREGEVVHIAMGGLSTADMVATGVSMVPVGADENEAEAETETDGDAPGDGDSEAVFASETSAGGCGCQGGAGSAILGPWLLLPMLRRRRRRATGG
ncbi:MAG: M36 family metallopeptidase [Myxococcota bacterium]